MRTELVTILRCNSSNCTQNIWRHYDKSNMKCGTVGGILYNN